MSSASLMRTCRQCGRQFLGTPRTQYCPECRAERHREQSRQFQQKNAAKKPCGSHQRLCDAFKSGTKDYQHEYRKAHLEKFAEYSKRHYENHRVQENARTADYKKAHLGKVRDYQKKYQQEYYQKHKEEILAKHKRAKN